MGCGPASSGYGVGLNQRASLRRHAGSGGEALVLLDSIQWPRVEQCRPAGMDDIGFASSQSNEKRKGHAIGKNLRP